MSIDLSRIEVKVEVEKGIALWKVLIGKSPVRIEVQARIVVLIIVEVR